MAGIEMFFENDGDSEGDRDVFIPIDIDNELSDGDGDSEGDSDVYQLI